MAVWVSVGFRPELVIRGAPKQPFKKMLFGAVIGDWTRRCTNDTFLAAPIKALLGLVASPRQIQLFQFNVGQYTLFAQGEQQRADCDRR